MINVIHLDGTKTRVRNDMLDVLIATGRIRSFKREEGWVSVDDKKVLLRDYCRESDYQGLDRRAPWPEKKLRK